MMHTVVLVVAAAYFLFGLFGLVVVSVPSNREDMFLEKGRPWVGRLRTGLAYLVLFAMAACGLSVWFAPPELAQALAWIALVAILAAKVVGLILKDRYASKRYVLIGSVVAVVTTLVIVAGVSSPSAA